MKAGVSMLSIALALTSGMGLAQAQSTPAAVAAAETEVRALGDMRLRDFAIKWMAQQQDLAQLGQYRDANRALQQQPRGAARVILFGDSITYHWTGEALPAVASLQWVNRGIPGQTSTQMLLRFEDDVVDLDPAAVVILAGTNDLRVYAGDPQAISAQMVEQILRNVTAMADIADARRIRVVLGAVPPVQDDPRKIARELPAIIEANRRLRVLANARGYPFVDYHQALASADGAIDPVLTRDGIHPNAAGYQRMWPRLAEALQRLGLLPK
jgi:lysophospholipase L1-like esterase